MKTVQLAGGLLAAFLVFPPLLRAQDADTAQPVVSDSTQKGTLTLGVQGNAAGESTKQVSVNVSPKEGGPSAVGNADVVGFPVIQNGQWADTDWKVNGSQITGTVKNRDGTTEGTFEGTLTATGVSGKFTHVDGRVGLWSWSGPPPGSSNGQ